MKKFLITLLLLCSVSVNSQTKYITKTGFVEFEASVPSFEEVAAKNNSVTAIINADNGEFAALAFVKAFRFKNALMEEHFNENYAESDQYPKATFKGQIANFDIEKLKEKRQSFIISGTLMFHGVSKKVDNISVNLKHDNETIVVSGSFNVLVSDFDIKIPKIVKDKLSNEVAISFSFELVKT
jgi:hypothetical protein